jgi:hypothetical protein
MAIKGKPLRQELVRTGDPDDWLEKVEDAFASAGFTKIRGIIYLTNPTFPPRGGLRWLGP